MAPARKHTQRDHAVYDRRSRPRAGSTAAPTGEAAPRRINWRYAMIIIAVAAVVAGLIVAARSLAHWPEVFF